MNLHGEVQHHLNCWKSGLRKSALGQSIDWFSAKSSAFQETELSRFFRIFSGVYARFNQGKDRH